MLRALFLQELRRSWLAHAALFAVVFGTAALVERAATRESPLSPDEEIFLGRLLFRGLLLSALISGERCFPAAFKEEGRYAFLLTLPRPRGGIWLAYLGGRLIGTLAALPVPLLVGPSLLLRWLPPGNWPFLIAELSFYLVYFLGSAALALALRKEILVYLVGLPLLTGLCALLTGYASYGFTDPQASSRYLGTLSCGSLLLALTCTAVSLRAFCRGEIHLGRRRARTLAEAGLAFAGLLVLALIAYGNSALAAIGGTWSPEAPTGDDFPYKVESRPTSADGRFLFIRQQLRERPGFMRLAVVDLENGKTTRWLEQPGMHQISWSASEPVLNVLADRTPYDCLGLPCRESLSWHRMSPDLHVLSTRKFPGTGFVRQLGSSLLLVTKRWSTGRFYRLSDRDGSFSEILTAELALATESHAWSLERGTVVAFYMPASLRAWWLDPQGRVYHEEAVSRKHPETYYFVGLRILSSQEVQPEAVRRAFPPPSDNIWTSWELLLPNVDGPLDFSSSQFYLESHKRTAAIWRYDVQKGTWSRILSKLHLPEARFVLRSLSEDTKPTRIDVDYRTWTWAAIVGSEGRHRLFLYDNRLGRSIPNTLACGPGEEGRTSLQQVQGLEGLLIRFLCRNQAGLLSYRLLQIVPGSGRVRDLPWHSMVERAELFERWIHLNPDGISVWVSTTGEVWQTGPGRKHLRLNPPSR